MKPDVSTKSLVWTTISIVAGILVALITMVKAVREPLEVRLETARQNYTRALQERDARMDYLQTQIDEIEHQLRDRRYR